MNTHPMDQFVMQPGSPGIMLLWLEASVLVTQIAVFALVLTGIPLWRLLPRVGISRWWAMAAAFPPAAIILFWIVGFRPWEHKE